MDEQNKNIEEKSIFSTPKVIFLFLSFLIGLCLVISFWILLFSPFSYLTETILKVGVLRNCFMISLVISFFVGIFNIYFGMVDKKIEILTSDDRFVKKMFNYVGIFYIIMPVIIFLLQFLLLFGHSKTQY